MPQLLQYSSYFVDQFAVSQLLGLCILEQLQYFNNMVKAVSQKKEEKVRFKLLNFLTACEYYFTKQHWYCLLDKQYLVFMQESNLNLKRRNKRK